MNKDDIILFSRKENLSLNIIEKYKNLANLAKFSVDYKSTNCLSDNVLSYGCTLSNDLPIEIRFKMTIKINLLKIYIKPKSKI